MKVKELIKNLSELRQDSEIEIYSCKDGNAVTPDEIIVADNDDDIPTTYHLYSSEDKTYNQQF